MKFILFDVWLQLLIFVVTLGASYYLVKLVTKLQRKILYPFERKVISAELIFAAILTFSGILIAPYLLQTNLNLFYVGVSSRVLAGAVAILLGLSYVLGILNYTSISQGKYRSILIIVMLFSFTYGINNYDFYMNFINAWNESNIILDALTLMALFQITSMIIGVLTLSGLVIISSQVRYRGFRKVELEFEGEAIHGLLINYDKDFYHVFDTKTKTITLYSRDITEKFIVSNESDVIDNYV